MSGSLTHRVSVAVDRSRFPSLFSFVEWGIDMQLADVRDMLRLPMPEVGLESGQNFAATASLVNLIAGASVWFYDASTAGLSDRDDRGRRYRETLAAYWPWDDGEIVGKADGTRLLYDCVRNPLAHAFGMPGLDDKGADRDSQRSADRRADCRAGSRRDAATRARANDQTGALGRAGARLLRR